MSAGDFVEDLVGGFGPGEGLAIVVRAPAVSREMRPLRYSVDWNAELSRGDLGNAVQQLKRESGKGLFVGGVKLPLALTELGR